MHDIFFYILTYHTLMCCFATPRSVLLKEEDSGSQAGQGIPRQKHAYRGRTRQSEAGQGNPRQAKAIRGRTMRILRQDHAYLKPLLKHIEAL